MRLDAHPPPRAFCASSYLQRRVVNMFERRPHNQRRVRDHGARDGRASVLRRDHSQIMN